MKSGKVSVGLLHIAKMESPLCFHSTTTDLCCPCYASVSRITLKTTAPICAVETVGNRDMLQQKYTTPLPITHSWQGVSAVSIVFNTLHTDIDKLRVSECRNVVPLSLFWYPVSFSSNQSRFKSLLTVYLSQWTTTLHRTYTSTLIEIEQPLSSRCKCWRVA